MLKFSKVNSVIDDQKEIVGTKTVKVSRKQNTKKTRKRGDSPVSNQYAENNILHIVIFKN